MRILSLLEICGFFDADRVAVEAGKKSSEMLRKIRVLKVYCEPKMHMTRFTVWILSVLIYVDPILYFGWSRLVSVRDVVSWSMILQKKGL